jgi:hypothetical protein
VEFRVSAFEHTSGSRLDDADSGVISVPVLR